MIKSIRLLTQQVYTTACDLVFPPTCVCCGRVGSLFCVRCLGRIENAPERVIPGLDAVYICAVYNEIMRRAIHAFKYEGQRHLDESLAGLLSDAVMDWAVDLVTAVPMHESRLELRGYNQSALLGQKLAQQHALPFVLPAIQRIRATTSQVDLTGAERRANVIGAFRADSRWVDGKRVLIVDDVLTTGATLTECATALRAAGASRVVGAIVASPWGEHE